MHYVNCVNCDAYYSADGNPYFVTESHDILCESCSVETTEVEKTDHGDTVKYTIVNEWSDELQYEEANDIEEYLKKNGISFVRTMIPDGPDVFELAKDDILVAQLKGHKVDDIFNCYVPSTY